MRLWGLGHRTGLGVRAARGKEKKAHRPATPAPLGRSVASLEPLEDRRLFAVAIPAGGEILVNTTTVESQLVNSRSHSVATDANGNSVIVWQSYGNDGAEWGIFARRFDSSGAPQGPEFQVNPLSPNQQTLPAVAMDASGNFTIAWRDMFRTGDSDLGGIFARRYNAAGVPQGADFQVNSTTVGDQSDPVVGMGAAGDTIIAWDSVGQDGSGMAIIARRYSAAGAPQGGEFRANTYTTGDQFGPSLAVGADGRFVVAWESVGQDGDQEGIYAQRYSPAGVPQGGEFHVSTETFSRQRHPVLEMDNAGNFVVAWSSNRQDGSSTGVFSQRYNASGAPLGGEYRVNITIANAQMYPSLSMDDAGNYVVTWTSDLQDGSASGVFSRQYNAAGVPTTGEVQVNTFTTGQQMYPTVAMDSRGDFLTTWQSQYQDGDAWGIYAQRFIIPDPNNTAPTGSAAQSIVVNQDSPDTAVSLWDLFSDAQTADSGLAYSVVSNSNSAVTTAINPATGTLTLHYLPGASGDGAVVVRATDPGGLSADTTLNVSVRAVVPPPTLPNAPSNPTAVATAARRIDVGWADNSNNETGFKVERSATGTGGWTLLATTAAGATGYGDTTVNPLTTYFYRVSATNAVGDSATTAVVSATTPDGSTVSQAFRADDAAVVWGGAFSAPYTESGRSARGLSSQYGDFSTVVNGHSATMSVFPFLADALSVTVDGVTTTPALTPNAWADVPLFTGLADGPHTVSVRNRYTRQQASVEIGRMITATGSHPGLSLRTGFSQNIYIPGTSPGVQRDNVMAVDQLNGNPGSIYGVDTSFRIKTAASAIKLWMNLGQDRVRLSIDGVEQQTASLILPDGVNNAGSGMGGMGWYDFATGLDTSREHEYRLWFEGTGTSSETSIVSQIMLVGGTLNTTNPPAPILPMLVGYGDSITLAQQSPTNHDSGVGFIHRIGVNRNMATYNLGLNGSSVHNFGGTGGNGTRSGVARTAEIPASASDIMVLYGVNDATNATIDSTIFRTDYGNMIAAIRASHPQARIYCIDLLPTTNATIAGKRPSFNAAIGDVVNAAADPNIIHITTDAIPGFDPAPARGLTYEGIHPTAAGYAVIEPYFRSFMPSAADTFAPVVTGASVDAAGTTLTINYGESVTGVAAADYTLSGATLSNVQGTGSTRTFTVSPAVQFGQALTLGYTGTGTRDLSNNALAAFSGRAVTNNVPAPVPAAPSNATATANSSSRVTVTWADNSGNETGFKVERSPNGTSGWTLLTTTPAGATSYVDNSVAAQTTYFYRVAATNSFGDSAYATAPSVTTPAAPDLTAPVLQSATVNRATLTLAYNEALDPASVPAAGAFTVSGHTVTGVSVSGSNVILTVSPIYAAGEAGGTVSYAIGAAPIQDPAGNDAAAFTGQAITNTTVAAPNSNPTAADDSATTPADTAVTVNVLANDGDVDGDALTVTALGAAAHGTVAVVAGGVRYTPAAGYNGPDAFTYTIGDGRGGTATATVRLGVGQFNVAPVINSASTNAGEIGNVAEGQAVTLSAAFSDTGATDTHTASINWGDGTVTAGTVNAAARTAAGSHVYTSGGAYNVTVTVTDNFGATSAASQLIVYVTGEGVRDGVLYVIGTRADERVYAMMYNTQIRVTAPFNPNFHRYFDTAAVSKIVMLLGDGNDQGSIYPDVPVSGVIDGGAGNDALGAGGRSLLIGGAGADSLTGGASADILIGGTTSYSSDPAKLVQVLDGTLPLSSANVFNDSGVDTFIGGNGTDIFWGNFAGDGVLDIFGQAVQPGETPNDLL
jgi:hypothetical protein